MDQLSWLGTLTYCWLIFWLTLYLGLTWIWLMHKFVASRETHDAAKRYWTQLFGQLENTGKDPEQIRRLLESMGDKGTKYPS